MARILICEAHDDISALLELVVRRLGHEPVAYAVGDAVAQVDAAVIEPGDPDGLRLARELRERDVPVLFTSIYPADEDVLDLQPATYLVKPFPLYALERALARALDSIPAAEPAAVPSAL
jgi:DNA-binding response OmpR family regulator